MGGSRPPRLPPGLAPLMRRSAPSCPPPPPPAGWAAVGPASRWGGHGGGGEEATHLPCRSRSPPEGRWEAGGPVAGCWGFCPVGPCLCLSPSGSRHRLSQRARTLAATLSFPINFPPRPSSRRVAHPPSGDLRSIDCGVGLTRLLAKLSTHALHFPEQLEFGFWGFGFFFGACLASCVGVSRVRSPAGFCKAGRWPCGGGVWPGLDSFPAFKTCLPCFSVNVRHFGS